MNAVQRVTSLASRVFGGAGDAAAFERLREAVGVSGVA